MLSPKVTKCKECADILPLIDEINCKIFQLSLKSYNNIVFSLNLYIDYTAILDLLHYKRILTYRILNPNYAGEISINAIASKVKLLKYK
jgi:hypothetical protein